MRVKPSVRKSQLYGKSVMWPEIFCNQLQITVIEIFDHQGIGKQGETYM